MVRATTVDVGSTEHTPGNGQEWTLAIFSDGGDWFMDGSLVPDNLPGSYTALLVDIDFDAVGDDVGFVLATVDSMTASAVPVPAAVWLFGSGLLGLIAAPKRKTIG